jgi:hypothetical protein
MNYLLEIVVSSDFPLDPESSWLKFLRFNLKLEGTEFTSLDP